MAKRTATDRAKSQQQTHDTEWALGLLDSRGIHTNSLAVKLACSRLGIDPDQISEADINRIADAMSGDNNAATALQLKSSDDAIERRADEVPAEAPDEPQGEGGLQEAIARASDDSDRADGVSFDVKLMAAAERGQAQALAAYASERVAECRTMTDLKVQAVRREIEETSKSISRYLGANVDRTATDAGIDVGESLKLLKQWSESHSQPKATPQTPTKGESPDLPEQWSELHSKAAEAKNNILNS